MSCCEITNDFIYYYFHKGWLVGFLWQKVHKGHTAPDKINQKHIINKRENKNDLNGVSYTD